MLLDHNLKWTECRQLRGLFFDVIWNARGLLLLLQDDD
jgi:hypothetical protein